MTKTRTRKTSQTTMTGRNWAVGLMALLSLAGLAVSVELTRIHYLTHTDPSFHSVCAMSEKVNCETVAQSPYSVFMDVPVSVWGMLGYAVFVALCLWGLSRKKPHPGFPRGGLLIISAVFCVVSIILAIISFTKIDSICLFCFTTYGINAVLLVLCLLAAAGVEGGLFKAIWMDLSAAVARPYLLAFSLIGGLSIAAALNLFFPRYYHHLGWTDLPKLASGTTEQGHHWIGAEQPELIIEEFSDYECPHCRRAHKHVRSLAAAYPDKVRMVHRHYPLDNACNPAISSPFHQRACELAIATECAADQGKFWEMSDAIFSIQDTMRVQNINLGKLAVQLGLDAGEFKKCLESDSAKHKVSRDIADGTRKGIQGTPTFYIDDQPFVGIVPELVLEQRVGSLKKTPTP
jgi:protein-disulfide isomerase/uncharacterized membrane protein